MTNKSVAKKNKAPKIVINGNDIKVKKIGRPSSFNQKIADDICFLISHGKSLRAIGKLEGFPTAQCVSLWLVQHESFFDQYIRARKAQALLIAEECLEDVKDRSRDVSGELQMPNGVAVQRDRLIYDANRWYLSKLLPKIFGEKIVHEGNADKPIELVVRVVGGEATRPARMLEASVPDKDQS